MKKNNFKIAFENTSAPKVTGKDIQVATKEYFSGAEKCNVNFAFQCVSLIASKYVIDPKTAKSWIKTESYQLYKSFVIFQYLNREPYTYDFDGLKDFARKQDSISDLRKFIDNIMN